MPNVHLTAVCATCLAALLAAGRLAAQAAPPLRDPAASYGSWGEAARETAAAIEGRTLARPADGVYAVGDAVVLADDAKRYRAHVVGFENGYYVLRYDGLDYPRTYAKAERLLGYQPGYTPARAASDAPAAFAVGEELDVEQGGRWYEGRVLAARGGRYRVHYDGQPSANDEWVEAARLRRSPGGPALTPRLAVGKYGCTTSSGSAYNGTYRINPKGSVVLAPDGSYQYLGFERPSAGRWRAGADVGTVEFTGGYLAGGVATAVTRRAGKYYLTAPGIGERWVCGFAG